MMEVDGVLEVVDLNVRDFSEILIRLFLIEI